MATRSVLRTFPFLAAIGAGLAMTAGLATAQSAPVWSPSVGLTANTSLGQRGQSLGPGVTAALLRRNGRFGFGVEIGYQGFGTEVTQVNDFNNEPGSVYREEFKRSMLRVAGLVHFEPGAGRFRPYLVAGAGAYDGRFRDRIEVRDPSGQRIPFYDFEGSGSDVKPGLTAGIGIVLTRPGRRMALGVEGRWHGIIDMTEDGLGTANFLSFGLNLRW